MLFNKNPYLVRGIVALLGNRNESDALECLMDFASSNRGRIIKRDFFAICIGEMFKRTASLQTVFQNQLKKPSIRGYFKHMQCIPLKQGVISIFPYNAIGHI